MKKISEKVLFDGQWIAVHGIEYENKSGQRVIWETVVRKHSAVGVVIIARLMPSRKLILIKQHRAAVDGYVLGFPAGLAFDDPNHALVELKEETGYTGKIVSVGPILKTGSSLINDSGRVICIAVDERNPANQNPVQELEPSEEIEVFTVGIDEVMDFARRQQEQGVYISSNLWYLFGLREFLH